jgi:hypothetical protein
MEGDKITVMVVSKHSQPSLQNSATPFHPDLNQASTIQKVTEMMLKIFVALLGI